MTRDRWIALVVLIVTVAATLLLIAWLEKAEGKVQWDCVDATERERVRQLVFDGIDKGLVNAMTHLFDIWQRDPENSQPKRAQVGTTNAVNAHVRGRKLAFQWDPPTCPPAPKEN